MSKPFPRVLLVAVALYVALRALILATSFHSVALPMYELYPMGTMAELELRGIDVPLAWFYDNAAGQILMGFLTVPVFWACGSTYLALKLLPALLGLLTLLALWRLLDRHFSRRAADVGALLFAVAPPLITKYSVINSGNHFENLLFTTLAILAAYRWFGSAHKGWAGLFTYGFACGLALFVFLGALIPVGLLFGMHVGLRGLWRTLRDLPVLLAGFALGVLPLLVVNAATSARGFGFLEAKFGGETSGRGGAVLDRTLDFLGPQLARAPVFEPFLGVSRELLTALFLVAFGVAYLASLPGVVGSLTGFARGLLGAPRGALGEQAAFQRAKLVPFVLYLPLAALAYGVSNFRLGGHAPPIEIAGYRYYLPTMLFALVAIVVWADRWIARGGRARLAGFALLSCAAVPSASSLGVVDWTFSNTGVGPRLDGYNLAQIARALVSARNAVPHDEVVARVEGFPSAVREQVITALGFNLGTKVLEQHGKSEEPIELDPQLEPWPIDWHVPWMRGFGAAVRFRDRFSGRSAEQSVRTAGTALWTPRGETAGGRAYSHALVGVAAPGVQLPPPWETAGVLTANDALHGLAAARTAGPRGGWDVFGYGEGLLLGRLWARGVPSDRDAAAPRVAAWLAIHSGGVSEGTAAGLGEGFAKQSTDWSGLGDLTRAAARDSQEFWRGFGRGLRIRLADASRVDRERLEKLAGGDEMRAFDDGWKRARDQGW